jgi:hypothetical protein
MSEGVINVPPDAGTSKRWGEWVITLEGSELRKSSGHEVCVVSPRQRSVCNYLARMQLADDLPSSCTWDLQTIGHGKRSEVLIPIRRLRSQVESDRLDDELGELYSAHFRGPIARVAAAFTMTVSEMTDNATTHGWSNVGVSYVAAQRYRADRCVLVVGDLGIGIPEHIRRVHPELSDDGDAIREATKEGVTGTGDSQRGIGYQQVIDSLKETQVPSGELRIWSGKGRFRIKTRDGLIERRRAWTVEEETAGTWVRLELCVR